MKKLQLLALLLLLPACNTVVHDGGKSQVTEEKFRMVMPPFLNATDNEHAGRALTQLAGSTLLEYGIPLHQTEDILSKTADETAPKPEARYLQIAQENIPMFGEMLKNIKPETMNNLNSPPVWGSLVALVLMAGAAAIVLHKRVKPE